MKYVVMPNCLRSIKAFYHNVARKYVHTYSSELMHKNIDETIDSMYKIENGLLRREPLLTKWKGCYMANTKKWYFAYVVYNDTVFIVDAVHAQNMTE